MKQPDELYHFTDREGKIPVRGKVLEAYTHRSLVMTWEMLCYEETTSEQPSRITWQIDQISSSPGVCRLTVTHDQFEDAPNTYRIVGNGWPTVLSGLKTLLETGEKLIDE